MIQQVIPVDYENQIKTCALLGGMSVQKQKRLLSYRPAIIIATPGRLWELMDDYMEPYLLNSLPMVDAVVLDEADRMVADGHFKELRFILEHIYTKRVEFKKEALNRNKQRKDAGKKGESTNDKLGQEIVKERLLESGFDARKNFVSGKNLISNDKLA